MKTKILLVEDNQSLSENVNEFLEIYGYEIVGTLTEANSASKEIEEKKPDLILIDIKLKGKKDGIELAEEIREHNEIPIVFLTSSTGTEIIQKVEHIRPDGFITKPFTFEALITSIELAISNYNKIEFVKTINDDNENYEQILIREHGWIRRILINDIDYIKIEGYYITINSNQKQYLIRNTGKELIRKMPKDQFAKINKSYIVNVNNVDGINSTCIKIKNNKIEVGKSYFKNLLNILNKR